MRFLLLLLFYFASVNSHGSYPPLFENCDAEQTLCFSIGSCAGGSADKLQQVQQADVDTLSCKIGLQIDMTEDLKWSVVLENHASDNGGVNELSAVAVKDVVEREMASCHKDITNDLYESTKEMDADPTHCKVTIMGYEDPVADIFHLSYGDSVLCLVMKFADGKESKACSDALKIDVFNQQCKYLESKCHENHKKCELATAKDNIFSCPDAEMNTLFLDGDIVEDSETARCTAIGWRSANTQTRPTGEILREYAAASPQCVSLCDDYFLQSSGGDQTPSIANGVMTCKDPYSVPTFNRELQIGKPITCAASKWKTAGGTIIPAYRGILDKVQCDRVIDQYLLNDCTRNIKTSSHSCSEFDTRKTGRGHLSCRYEEEATVLYEGGTYLGMLLDLNKNEWVNAFGSGDNSIGPIDLKKKPYCVYVCSDVFINQTCRRGGRSSCNQALHTTTKTSHGQIQGLQSTLKCNEPDDLLIIDSVPYFGDDLHCNQGEWAAKDGKTFVNFAEKASSKPSFDVLCHKSCDQSLTVNSCEPRELHCRRFTKKPDNTIGCVDETHVIHSSATAITARSVNIFSDKTFDKLKCTKQGWIGDDEMVLDFSKYPRNDINIACRSKCSSKFATCAGKNCPTRSNSELSCTNNGIIRINNITSMEAVECDAAQGWLEKTSKKLLVDFSTTSYRVTVSCAESCTEALLEDDCAGQESCEKPTLKDKTLTCNSKDKVMRVNGRLEFDHLTCSLHSWTLTNPTPIEIPRTTFEETIKVSCLSKCDVSFVTKSDCAAGTCDTFSYDGTTLKCDNEKNFIVANSTISRTEFTCNPLTGWTDGESNLIAFTKDATNLNITAHCFRNCDLSRINDLCNSGTNCKKFIYENDALACPAGHFLRIDGNDIFENVICERAGFKKASDGLFVLKFEAANTDTKISATCLPIPCSRVSPLKTTCEGLTVSCVDNLSTLLENSEKSALESGEEPTAVTCPEGNQMYHSTAPNQWHLINSITCQKDGKWLLHAEKDQTIGGGERVICASGDPVITTTTEAPTTPSPDPADPCSGCRTAIVVSACGECIPYDKGGVVFSKSGENCIAKSSTGVFELGGDNRVYEELHCSLEDGKYVWKTKDGNNVVKFAAHRSSPPPKLSTSKMGLMVAIAMLFLFGVIGLVSFIVWCRKRESQKREAAKIKGLEQKNDEILDQIESDDPRTLRL